MKISEHVFISAIRDMTKRAFDLSQDKCPVDTGFLKRSGSIKDQQDGATIDYSAPYAGVVEDGMTGGPVKVKAHLRAGSPVRSYVYNQPPRKATLFIKSSIDEAFQGIGEAIGDRIVSETKYRRE